MDEDIVISPEELAFKGNATQIYLYDTPHVLIVSSPESITAEQYFSIENYGEVTQVFRIRVSTPNVFVLQVATGTVEPQHSVDIPISLKKTLPADFMHVTELFVKLSIEFVSYHPDYEALGSKAFWMSRNGDAVKKTVVCEIVRTPKIPKVDPLATNVRNAFVSIPSKLEISAAENMQISPKILHFEGETA